MNEPLSIRPLAYADLPEVLAIERRAFTMPWSLAMFTLELSKPSGVCLAAERGGRVVGYLVCSRYGGDWHLMNVAVDDRLRRQGIATALMERMLEATDRPGARYTLEVRASNRVAIALYERFAFRPAGVRKGYYHDNREDAFIMWRAPAAGGAAADGGESSVDRLAPPAATEGHTAASPRADATAEA